MDYLKIPSGLGIMCACCPKPAAHIATERIGDGLPLCGYCKRKYRGKSIQELNEIIDREK